MTQSLTSDAATSTAERGFSGGGSEFPHKGAIESSFGRSLSATAHQDDNAHEACDTLGAKAYAYGDSVAFGAGSTDLHTAAHEAAHTIQQQGGVQLKGGASNDAYEQHADAAADLVVAGKSSAHMFSPGAAATGIQRKALQLKPDTDLKKLPNAKPSVDVNGLPTKKNKSMNAEQQALFNRMVLANNRVQVVAGKFDMWLSSMTIPYGSAWLSHQRAIASANQAVKDAQALVMNLVLAGLGGVVGGLVGELYKKLGSGAAVIDGMKDLAKFGVRDTGARGLEAVKAVPRGFDKMPPDPLMWSSAVNLRVRSEVTQPALEIVEQWQQTLVENPDQFNPNFDPVAEINDKLRVMIGGKPLATLEPEDQAALILPFERGFLNDWIASEALRAFGSMNEQLWGKARSKLVQYGHQIGMADIEQTIERALAPLKAAREAGISDAAAATGR